MLTEEILVLISDMGREIARLREALEDICTFCPHCSINADKALAQPQEAEHAD
jgi:hypothetical protein